MTGMKTQPIAQTDLAGNAGIPGAACSAAPRGQALVSFDY